MKYLILSMVIINTFYVQAKEESKEWKNLNVHLCIGSKEEYKFCKDREMKECMESSKKRYSKDLNCTTRLNGLKLEEDNYYYKNVKMDWEATCATVTRELKYCMKEDLVDCVKSMKKRYKNLYCEILYVDKPVHSYQ